MPDYTRVKDSMAVYRFESAIDMLEEDIALRTKKKKSTEEAESLLAVAQRNQGKLMATERVTVIDSVVVDKEKFLSCYFTGGENGNISLFRDYFNIPDTLGCTVFCNQLGNQMVFAQPSKGGRPRLFMSHKFGGEWSKAEALKGLAEDDYVQNYPFMLNDGVTLYYAAKNEEDGIGGYDIYMTRYDSDTRSFLAPENIGMPFNSPDNDYMYVIDELNGLGWFATDRQQPNGKVCIYTFIPNETRHIYNEDVVGAEKLSRLGRIASIRETWADNNAVTNALSRLATLRSSGSGTKKQHDFDFVVNDRVTHTSLSDFKSEYGKANAKWWAENIKDLTKLKEELAKLRDRYASENTAGKQQVAVQIRIMEEKTEQLAAAIKAQEKNIRNAENKAQ